MCADVSPPAPAIILDARKRTPVAVAAAIRRKVRQQPARGQQHALHVRLKPDESLDVVKRERVTTIRVRDDETMARPVDLASKDQPFLATRKRPREAHQPNYRRLRQSHIGGTPVPV